MNQRKPIKTMSLIGLGAVGCFFTPHLQRILGDRLRIIAGGSRKDRLERDGIIVNGVDYRFHLVSPEEDCNDDYPNLTIIITEFTSLNQAIQNVKSQIGPKTLIMAPLDGAEAEDVVTAVYGWDNLFCSLAKVSVVMEDGQAIFDPKVARIELGERKNETISPRVQSVKDLLEAAGICAIIPKDTGRAIWYKYMCNVNENQSTAVLGIPFGAWSVSVDANFTREALMQEVVAVAGKKGVRLTEEDMEKQAERFAVVFPKNRPSTLQDIEAGRRTEVEVFGGAMIRMGRELGVPTPYNELFYHTIKVPEQENEGLF